MNGRKVLVLLITTAFIFLILGLIAGQYFKLPLLKADSPLIGGSIVTSHHNPLIVDPKSKILTAVRWKENITKEDPYVCPTDYKPTGGAMFSGSGTASDPYYLKFTVNSVSRDGQPYTLKDKGPLIQEPHNALDLIILSYDLVATNPRLSTEFPNLIVVDLSRISNTILPKYAYINSTSLSTYLKESDVVGASIKKTPFDNDPDWWPICAKPTTDNAVSATSE